MFSNVLFVASILAFHTSLTVSKPDVPAPCAHAIPAEWFGGDKKLKKGWKCSSQGFSDQTVLVCTQRIDTPPAVSCSTKSKPGEVVLSHSSCDLGYSITSSNDGTLSTKAKGNVTVDKFLCKDSGFPEPLICDPGSPSGVFNWCYPSPSLFKDTPWIYKEAAPQRTKSEKVTKTDKVAKPGKVEKPDKVEKSDKVAKPGKEAKPAGNTDNSEDGDGPNEDIIEEAEEDINDDIKKANGGETADDRGKATTGNVFASSTSTSSTSLTTKFPRKESFLFVVMGIWANF